MLVFIYLFLHNDLPGTKSDQLKELLFWTILFGPCLFPLSLIIWHCYQLSQGESNFMKFENVARSRVLNSLSVLTKSGVQVASAFQSDLHACEFALAGCPTAVCDRGLNMYSKPKSSSSQI